MTHKMSKISFMIHSRRKNSKLKGICCKMGYFSYKHFYDVIENNFRLAKNR
jgi:hypothetical protein